MNTDQLVIAEGEETLTPSHTDGSINQRKTIDISSDKSDSVIESAISIALKGDLILMAPDCDDKQISLVISQAPVGASVSHLLGGKPYTTVISDDTPVDRAVIEDKLAKGEPLSSKVDALGGHTVPNVELPSPICPICNDKSVISGVCMNGCKEEELSPSFIESAVKRIGESVGAGPAFIQTVLNTLTKSKGESTVTVKIENNTAANVVATEEKKGFFDSMKDSVSGFFAKKDDASNVKAKDKKKDKFSFGGFFKKVGTAIVGGITAGVATIFAGGGRMTTAAVSTGTACLASGAMGGGLLIAGLILPFFYVLLRVIIALFKKRALTVPFFVLAVGEALFFGVFAYFVAPLIASIFISGGLTLGAILV